MGWPKLDISSQTLTDPTNAWAVDQQSGKVNVNFFGDLNLNGNSILNVSKILGMDGKWRIDSDGTMIAVRVITDEIIAKIVRSEKLCLGQTCVTEEQLKVLLENIPQGLTSAGGETLATTTTETATSTVISN